MHSRPFFEPSSQVPSSVTQQHLSLVLAASFSLVTFNYNLITENARQSRVSASGPTNNGPFDRRSFEPAF
jgi:hypothetical protein